MPPAAHEGIIFGTRLSLAFAFGLLAVAWPIQVLWRHCRGRFSAWVERGRP